MIAKEVGNHVDDDGYVPVICGLSRCKKGDIDAAWEGVRYALRLRIHTFIASSEIHLRHKLRKTPEEVIQIASEMVAYARSLGCEDMEFSPENAGSLPSSSIPVLEQLKVVISGGEREDILELEFQGKKKSFKMLQVWVLLAVNPAERMDHESMGWDILLTRTSLKLQKLLTLELIKEVVATRINIITEAITITMMVVQLVWPITFEMVSSRPVSKIVSVVVAAEKGSGEHQQQVGSRKLIIIANNCPPLRKFEIEYYAMLSKTGVHHYSGNNVDLGTACGKDYRVCSLSITDPGKCRFFLGVCKNFTDL
ncbi:hypothetical protein R1sor_015030 [Riccia sorocarpa]|uniref:Ribosomal protein L7Ae/L30e/S12e/Gadd45 domain-containing protein n=1 Tax=Riccia sorocarpa TaxID=122646 RepID=A0ABD3HFC1_9MARC